MQQQNPIEAALEAAIRTAAGDTCPPGLASALRWAVFPGGARIRPRLCLAVAQACGDLGKAAVVAGASVELLHCASLVHDDLPCFDNAATRRGKASVQAQYGERLAVLTGDALIVLAYETLARHLANDAERLAKLLMVVSKGVGAPAGIAAGQAWECEPQVDLSAYQQAKTGALFAAATELGAVAAGYQSSMLWAELGSRLGEAYQVADDILDAAGDPEQIGKPVHQDTILERPNAVAELGLQGASRRLRQLVNAAVEAIPACDGQDTLRVRIRAEAEKLLPPDIAALAA